MLKSSSLGPPPPKAAPDLLPVQESRDKAPTTWRTPAVRRPLVLGQRHSAPQPVRADIAPPDDLSIPVMPPLPLRPDEGPRWHEQR